MGLSSPKDRGENKQYLKQPPTSFFQVTLWYPKWRARFHPWKGHLKHPKRSRTEEPGRKLQDEKKGLNRWWSPTSFSAPQRPRTFEEEAYRIATFFSQTSRPSRQRHRSFKYKVDSKKVRFFLGGKTEVTSHDSTKSKQINNHVGGGKASSLLRSKFTWLELQLFQGEDVCLSPWDSVTFQATRWTPGELISRTFWLIGVNVSPGESHSFKRPCIRVIYN